MAEGVVGKLEVVRGISNRVRYTPRLDGAQVEATAPALRLIAGPEGGSVEPNLPAVTATEGVLHFDWTPGAALALDEDYRFEIRWTDTDNQVHDDVVYFDVVRVPLTCPVDDALLEAREPLLPKHLAALGLATAQQFIQTAWSHVVAKIRGMGFRPSLVTDRHAFTEPAVALALEHLMVALVRSPGDLYDRKAAIYRATQDAAWGAVGRVKFADDSGAVAGDASALPRFRI